MIDLILCMEFDEYVYEQGSMEITLPVVLWYDLDFRFEAGHPTRVSYNRSRLQQYNMCQNSNNKNQKRVSY